MTTRLIDAAGFHARQEMGRRSKRRRVEDPNEGLTLALLETVRQALDEGEEADGQVCAPTTHSDDPNSQPSDSTQHGEAAEQPSPGQSGGEQAQHVGHAAPPAPSLLLPRPLARQRQAPGRKPAAAGRGKPCAGMSTQQEKLLPGEGGEAEAGQQLESQQEPAQATAAAQPEPRGPAHQIDEDDGYVGAYGRADSLPPGGQPQEQRRGPGRPPKPPKAPPQPQAQAPAPGQPQGQAQAPTPGQPQGQAQPPGSASLGSADTQVETGDGGTNDLDEGEDEGEEGEEGFLPRKKQDKSKVGVPGGPCAHCGTTESPQWRRPLTKKIVLCNACGIYFSRHHSLPKRKKVRGASAQVIPAPARPIFIPPPKEPPPPSIICEEKLEVDDLPSAQVTAAARAAMQQAQALMLPPMLQQAQSMSLHVDAKPQPASTAPTMPPPAPLTGAAVKARKPAVHQRTALSLPLMTALPVVGGINRVVQTYLHPQAATQYPMHPPPPPHQPLVNLQARR